MKLSPFVNKLVLAAFGISGAAALMYEVIWTRALSLVLGSTVYAVSTMLTAFMSGLALGSYLGGIAGDRHRNPLFLFGLCEIGIGIFGVLTIPLIQNLPPLYFLLFKKFHLNLQMFFALQFCMCMLIMLVPTTLMGATFPLVGKIRVDSMSGLGREIGTIYSFNTLGAVAGSFSAGFILIPMLGMKLSTIAAGGVNIFTGTIVIIAALGRRSAAPLVLLIGIFGLVSLLGGRGGTAQGYAYNFYKNGRYFDLKTVMEDEKKMRLVFNYDDPNGTVKVYLDSSSKMLMLENGGKVEGSFGMDVPNEALLAYLPIGAKPDAKDFLVIGLGTGMTLQSAKNMIGRADCVEINPTVASAVERYFFPGLLKSGVNIHIMDARTYMGVTDKKYDIISSEPSYPTESVAGNLFTLEFFKLASERLRPGGVFAQWLPFYQMSRDDVTTVVKTFQRVFPEVMIWNVPLSSDLIILGSDRPFRDSPNVIAQRARDMSELPMILRFGLSKTPAQIRNIIRKNPNLPYNTDDRPVTEFAVTRRLILQPGFDEQAGMHK